LPIQLKPDEGENQDANKYQDPFFSSQDNGNTPELLVGQDNGNTNKTENIDEGKEGNENEQEPVKKNVLRKQHSILKKQK
jgi:hypothetical protein